MSFFLCLRRPLVEAVDFFASLDMILVPTEQEETVSQIAGILCQVITSNVDNAGTDGRVFLGVGGREFRLDSKEDDYERASWREYIMGDAGWSSSGGFPPLRPVQNPQWNDPRKDFPLDTVNLTKSPVYIRFEPAGDSPNWNVAWVAALVYDPNFVAAFTPPAAFKSLWMGDPMGEFLFLTDAYWREERPIRDLGLKIARETGARIEEAVG
jgi:hypothetical protein